MYHREELIRVFKSCFINFKDIASLILQIKILILRINLYYFTKIQKYFVDFLIFVQCHQMVE